MIINIYYAISCEALSGIYLQIMWGRLVVSGVGDLQAKRLVAFHFQNELMSPFSTFTPSDLVWAVKQVYLGMSDAQALTYT